MIYERETFSGIFYCRWRARSASDTRADNLRIPIIMSKLSTRDPCVPRNDNPAKLHRRAFPILANGEFETETCNFHAYVSRYLIEP